MYGRGIVEGTQHRSSRIACCDPTVLAGMQGNDPTNRITAAEMKHYTAYGVESNRFGFRGYVSVYDMVRRP